jgi:NADH:ubiquinone oxidoreductase subunit K
MKFKPLKQLHRLKGLVKKEAVDKELSQIELLLHSTNVNLFAMRLIHDEIIVPNKAEIMAMTLAEIRRMHTMLHVWDEEDSITCKDAKQTFKRLGIKPKHIKT